jgi:hypothetical protein
VKVKENSCWFVVLSVIKSIASFLLLLLKLIKHRRLQIGDLNLPTRKQIRNREDIPISELNGFLPGQRIRLEREYWNLGA